MGRGVGIQGVGYTPLRREMGPEISPEGTWDQRYPTPPTPTPERLWEKEGTRHGTRDTLPPPWIPYPPSPRIPNRPPPNPPKGYGTRDTLPLPTEPQKLAVRILLECFLFLWLLLSFYAYCICHGMFWKPPYLRLTLLH